jgi:hypothetical protein
MKASARLLAALAIGAVSLAMGSPQPAWAKRAPRTGPVVVELFTAQGCSSCKKANRLIARMAGQPGLIVLTWSVDYWDYLGWKDTFAQPEFTARQRAFARRLGPEDVYTPQVVVDGAGQVSGDDAAGVQALVQAAERDRRRGPRISVLGDARPAGGRADGGRVSVGAGRVEGRADVWLVRYDPREQDVVVKAGDNRGATVVHRDVVCEVVRLGVWRGRKVRLAIPPPDAPGLAGVVIVEGAHGGPILGAAEVKPRKP